MVPGANRDLRAGPTREIALMTQTYTAVIKQSGPWWIGWIEEVPGVNRQEGTRAELLETLRITLREALELNRREALEAAAEDPKDS
jgi:predicted RNase H-like HicB family nuclease